MVEIIEVEKYLDYGKCLKISNGVIEAYVTLDLGPRIIRFGFVGGQNILFDVRSEIEVKNDKEYTDFFGENRKWEIFGGHRIWLSPESYPETYTPDDRPITYEITSNGAIFTPCPDNEIGVQKSLEVVMDNDDSNMLVKMRVKNITDKEKEFSVWGLTVSNKDGTLIIPMNTRKSGCLNNRIISIWPYTDISDNRINFGKKYVTLKQDRNADSELKLGFDLDCGSIYYVINEDVFIKKYNTNHPNGKYPDGGCSFETYTCKSMLEIESLGELKTINFGETNYHEEMWSLVKMPCEVDFKNEDSIDKFLKKI